MLWYSFMSGCSCFVICGYCLFRGLCFGGGFLLLGFVDLFDCGCWLGFVVVWCGFGCLHAVLLVVIVVSGYGFFVVGLVIWCFCGGALPRLVDWLLLILDLIWVRADCGSVLWVGVGALGRVWLVGLRFASCAF